MDCEWSNAYLMRERAIFQLKVQCPEFDRTALAFSGRVSDETATNTASHLKQAFL
jgi:hypothetical protein